MLFFIFLLIFLGAFLLTVSVVPPERVESRPTLRTVQVSPQEEFQPSRLRKTTLLHKIASINGPLARSSIGQRIARGLSMAHVSLSAEEFLLIKEILIAGLAGLFHFIFGQKEFMFLSVASAFVIGFMLPEFWLKGKIKKVKSVITKQLPDVIDLLGLCVNAGLDFMLALKWVIEKSPSSVLVDELSLIMQEINVGKTRRNALVDLAKKYDIPDLATFTRVLIQADRMGTSVAEALGIISEDMRLSRFRRGEQTALKAPLKMLIPLLLCIFPVVGILVVAPILIDFVHNNPMQQLSSGIAGK